MHKITLSQETNLGKRLGILKPGSYICHDLNAFEIAQIAPRGAATVDKYDDFFAPFRPGTATCIMRSGAWGDLLLLTPALKALREKHPASSVVLSCFEQHHDLFRGVEAVSDCVAYPMPANYTTEFAAVISLENVMELSDKHATDAFADALGVTVTDYKPIFELGPMDAIEAGVVTHKPRPVCGVQMVASVANRNYHMAQWAHVITQLVASGWDIWLFGIKGQLPKMQRDVAHITDLSERDMTFRESAAWLSYCDAFVGVDSSLIHLCHALDVPAVGLYGPFSWEKRTSKAPKTFAIQGKGPCAPCNWHMHAGRQFPPNQPCSTAGYCTVLADIAPQRIVAQVNKLKPDA